MQYINGKPVDTPEEEGLEIAPEDQYLLPPQERREEAPEIGIIKELDPKKILNEIRNHMLGRIWDENKKEYVQFRKEPLMNEEGVSLYLSLISAPVSSLTTFSNYDINEIPDLVFFVCEKAIPTIHVNYKKYGIKDKCHLPIIDEQIFILTLSAFKKALGAGDRNVIGRTVAEQIRSGTAIQSLREKKSIWSRLSPFGRR